MPLWVRCWLVLLVISVLSSVAFLPHPYAITNVVGMVVILMLNGREIVRIRGVNKNMGGPHLVAWIPVLVVDAMTLFSSKIDGQQLMWENAGGNAYSNNRTRVFFVWYNFVTLIISCLFVAYDTIAYYILEKTEVIRSSWTVEQLKVKNVKKNIRPNDLNDFR
jgi:hypothetical protein